MAAAAWVWREDILRTALDPRIPYQTYDPPPAPDYGARKAWAILPTTAGADTGAASGAGPMDVFFVHPTTFDGGEHWNAPVDAPRAERLLRREVLPNHAGPYQRLGRVFAPHYRQASFYTLLTLRDDARDARRFAYRDIRAALRRYLSDHNGGRPFMVVGVEQGGTLAARLLTEEVAPNPAVRARLVAAHLIGTVTPPIADLPTCAAPAQTGCVLAFVSVLEGEGAQARRLLDRALVWRGDRLDGLEGRTPVCVNPLLGAPGAATASENLGAANATGLEWGARPAFLRQQVGAACMNGVLHLTRPESPSLQRPRGWPERLRAPAYNLFYADLEADAAGRLAAWRSARAGAAVGTPVEQFR